MRESTVVQSIRHYRERGGKSILALSDGGFLVTGARVELMGGTEAGEGGEGMIMRMDYDGNVLWDHLYEGLQWVFEARKCPVASWWSATMGTTRWSWG